MTQFLWGLLQSSLFLAIAGALATILLRYMDLKSCRIHTWTWWLVLANGIVLTSVSVSIPWPRAGVAQNDLQRRPSDSGMLHYAVGSEGTKPTKTASDRRESIAARDQNWNWSIVLLVTWGTGIAVVGARWLTDLIRFQRHCVVKACDNPQWNQQWDDLLGKCGIESDIPLQVSPNLGPFLCYSLSGYRLVVPDSFWTSITEQQRESILRHELAHYQRSDLWKSVAAHFLALPHWFNPLAWVAVRKLEECSEWACDDSAAESGSESSANYAKALIAICERSVGRSTWAQAMSGGVLSRRIERIMSLDQKRDSVGNQVLVAAVMVVLISIHAVRVELVAQEPQTIQEETPAGTDTAKTSDGMSIYLSWRNTENTNFPPAGSYWTVGAKKVTDDKLLHQLRQTPMHARSGTTPELLIYASHREFGAGAWGHVQLLDSDGHEIPCFQGIASWGVRYASEGAPGLMSFSSDIQTAPMWPGNGPVPPTGTVLLRYTTGEPELVAEFGVDERPGTMFPRGARVSESVTLLGIGENAKGNAFVSIYAHKDVADGFVFSVTGYDGQSNEVRSSGSSWADQPRDSRYAITTTFLQPLGNFEKLQLKRLAIRDKEFRDVSFQPGTKEPEPPSDPAPSASAQQLKSPVTGAEALLNRLQGEWVVDSVSEDGVKSSVSYDFLIKGSRVDMRTKESGQQLGVMDLVFEAVSEPQGVTVVHYDPKGKPIRMLGIIECAEDRLRLCCRARGGDGRPTQFTGGKAIWLYQAHRRARPGLDQEQTKANRDAGSARATVPQETERG